MINVVNSALEAYEQKWQALISVRHERQLFSSLRPTAVAWKVADHAEFNARLIELQSVSAQIHLGWINERWLATVCLRGGTLANGASIIKLMERRPGSTNPVGLDHVDFLTNESMHIKSVLVSESDLKWSEEMNGDNCRWISIWFDDTEAKLRADTVLNVCANELLDLQKRIIL